MACPQWRVSFSVAVAVAVAVAAGVTCCAAAERPNVLFILADDWGWGDVGAYGANGKYTFTGTMVKTPHLDKLASEGTLFTDFHVAQSFCAPTRTSFLTGRFPADLSVNSNWDTTLDGYVANAKAGLPYFVNTSLPNVPRALREAGYRTGHFGKWHLGGFAPPDSGIKTPVPSDYGFDVTGTYASVVESDPSLRTAKDMCATNASDPFESADVGNFILTQGIKFMNESVAAGKPFYLDLWFHMSHNTIDPRPEWLAPYPFKETCLFMAKQAGQTICPAQIYWGAQTATDSRFGEVLGMLDTLGIRNNTLVVFSTDNGAQTRTWTNGQQGVMDNAIGVQGPFRGCKGSLYDGGHRVPFIASWPGKVPAGRVDHSLLGSVDWLPTLLSITGASVPPTTLLRGEDISDVLFGRASHLIQRTKPLLWRGGGAPPPCWNRSPGLAIRNGDLKLLFNPDGTRFELYNMSVAQLPTLGGFFEAQSLVGQPGTEAAIAALHQQALAWHRSIPPIRPGADDKQTSVDGCNRYAFPGL